MRTSNLMNPTATHEHGPVNPPLPIRKSGRRGLAVEMRGDWAPWIPLHDANPEVSSPLRTIAGIVVVLVLFFLMLLAFVPMAF